MWVDNPLLIDGPDIIFGTTLVSGNTFLFPYCFEGMVGVAGVNRKGEGK